MELVLYKWDTLPCVLTTKYAICILRLLSHFNVARVPCTVAHCSSTLFLDDDDENEDEDEDENDDDDDDDDDDACGTILWPPNF